MNISRLQSALELLVGVVPGAAGVGLTWPSPPPPTSFVSVFLFTSYDFLGFHGLKSPQGPTSSFQPFMETMSCLNTTCVWEYQYFPRSSGIDCSLRGGERREEGGGKIMFL